LLAFTLPETSSATILYKRAQRLREAKTDPSFKSESEIEAESISTRDLVKEGLWRPFQLAFQEPILFALNVYLGLIYALLYTWFEAFPIAFIETYGFSLGTQGLAFLGILVGCLIVCIPYFYWLRVVQEKQFDEGTMTPEKRLPPAIVGSFLIPICLFWFGWSVRPSVHWIVPIIGSSLFSMGAVLLFNAILNYQSDAYPK
jgi:DHA1 family multidrug resistance protein-like MFS transporter